MKKLLFAAICVFVLQPNVFAQATWGGLSFGESLDQARSYLLMQGVELEKREVSWNIRQGWDLTPPGTANVVLHFTPRLYFSASDQLERIVLGLNDRDGDLASVAATTVREQLIGKYGQPASETPACAGTDLPLSGGNQRQIECRAVWRAQQQIVTLHWTYTGPNSRRLEFEVAYVVAQNSF